MSISVAIFLVGCVIYWQNVLAQEAAEQAQRDAAFIARYGNDDIDDF